MRATFHLKALSVAVATLSIASMSQAAGLDRSGQDITAFLQDGTYAEAVYTYIDADVSGYDSDDMVADNSVSRDTNDEATSDSTTDNSRVLERTVKGNQGNRLKDRELALQLLDNNYLDTIFTDVSRELGLLIY